MSKTRLALALAGLLLASVFANSTQASRTIIAPGSPFIVDVWGIEDGLPQSSVFSIAQTYDGYLWLGTLNGLVRFDGLKFTRFDESNTPGLSSSRIVHLFEDSRTNLWVCTENAGVSLIEKNGKVRSFDVGQGISGVRFFTGEDSNGTVWILTPSGYLGLYNDAKMNSRFAGCKILFTEKTGKVWLGTDQALIPLQATAADTSAFVLEPEIPVGHLDFALASKAGGYWRMADRRIQKWKGNQREKDFGPYPWPEGTPIMAACEDREGNLIVGTYGNGVYWFRPDRQVIHLGAELSHNSVLSVMVDREGNLWIGTNGGGLNRVKRKIFETLAESEGSVVQSVAEDKEGGLWIGYNGQSRVDYHRPKSNQRFSILSDFGLAANCDVKSVFVDNDQRVWAGVWFNGEAGKLPLRLFQFQNESFVPVGNPVLTGKDISVMFQDRAGEMWVGTRSALTRVGKDQLTLFTADNGLPSSEIRAICEDAQGTFWIATANGLASFREGRFTLFQKKDGLPSDDLSCLYLDSAGALWIGTRGSGLCRFYHNQWTAYTTADGLSGNSIGYIIEDSEGTFWIGSNAGLMRVPKKTLDDFADKTIASFVCRAYVEADGLPTRECTQGSQPSACRAADGTLWFPTTRGLVSVKPSDLRKNPYQPPVIIESIKVEGVEQLTNPEASSASRERLRGVSVPEIVVPPGKEHLEIHYTSLNLGAAAQSRFRYRLRGHEKDWNEVGNLREARYSRLPARDYTFEVSAANEDGVWNPVASTQIIRVQPPFWKTAGFISISSLVALGLIIGTVYFLSTQKLQRQLAVLKQQEELEKERARIARDLHDQLGANLMQVALLGELAEADKDLPEEVEGHAKQIYETARETTKALDEIVWAVNPSNDTLDGLVNYICKYAQEYYELAGLRYRIEVPTELPQVTLPPEVRHNVFLAAKEAVNNVVKHAEATSAWLRLKLEPDRFTIEIEDDGRGLGDMNEKTGRNGLRNMRKRLEDVGGNFSIAPAPEKGAVVRLSAPIKTI